MATRTTITAEAKAMLTPRTVDAQDIGAAAAGLVGTGTVSEQTFGTGSLGFRAFGKVSVNGEQYQTEVRLTRIGTKAAAQGLAS